MTTNLTAEEIQRLPGLVRDNFDVFMEEVIGLNNAPFHDELDQIISNPLYRKIAIAYPRGHGKSTHLSVGYPLWEIAKNHNLRILIVSSTATLSSAFITEIRNHLEGNEKYLEWTKTVDPEGKGVVPKYRKIGRGEEKWSSEAVTIDRDNKSLKDPTILSVGLFGSLVSKRADIIICDDIVNQLNAETEDQRIKVKDWVYTSLLPILDPINGRFIYLGNTWHQDDLVANLLKDPIFNFRDKKKSIISDSNHPELWNEWASIKLNEESTVEEQEAQSEAYYQQHKQEMDDGVQLLWPERFSYKFLYLERLSNPFSFARMYQCDPSLRPDQKIKEEWLQKAIHKGRNLSLQDAPRKGLTMKDTTAGLDLAISQKKGSDDTVFLSLDIVQYGDGELEPGDVIIRNIDRGKFTPAQVRDMVVQKYSNIHHSGIRVESVQYQESMAIDLAGFGLPIKSYATGREKNDPEMGVYSIANMLERGKFVIPYSKTDPRTIMVCSQLLNELRNWPDGHTGDSLMALWFAYAEMRTHIGRKMTHPKTSFDVEREALQELEIRNLSDEEKRKEMERMLDAKLMKEGEARRRNETFVPPTPQTLSKEPYIKRFQF